MAARQTQLPVEVEGVHASTGRLQGRGAPLRLRARWRAAGRTRRRQSGKCPAPASEQHACAQPLPRRPRGPPAAALPLLMP